MEMEYTPGPMELDTKVPIGTVKRMGKVFTIFKMEENVKDSGKTVS